MEGTLSGGLIASPTMADSAIGNAIDALLSMGFTQQEAELALKGANEAIDFNGTSSEEIESELIHYALKRLGSAPE